LPAVVVFKASTAVTLCGTKSGKKNAGMSWSVRLALYRKAAVYLPRDLNEKMNIYLPERNLKPFWLQTAVAEN